MRTIRRAAVLGAGVMGAQIAAHLANAGIPVALLDVVPPDLKRLAEMKPSPLMHPRALGLISPGLVANDLGRLADADWIVEAVVEKLDAKQELWRTVGPVVRPGAILSSNTSGLSIAAQAEALPPEHRRAFLGTHFFNPPRYLKLLELIPTAETDPEVVAFVSDFATRILGKGVVVANDTPNFIANRIGMHGLALVLQAAEELGLGVDEVDALTGPAMGRPRSGTFRLLDLVGLDTVVYAARTSGEKLPGYVEEMVRRGWLGEKAGQGFYRRVDGDILSLDLETLEYGPRKPGPQLPTAGTAHERVRAAVGNPFVWRTLSRTLLFCAEKAQEIANGDLGAIDRAMRWGFNWEIGPFEAWNALGVRETAERMAAEGLRVPDWVGSVERFRLDRSGEQPLSFALQKSEPSRVVRATPGATLVDLGAEVLGLEFHSPKQAIGQDYVALANAAAEEVRRTWRGLVVSASAPNFCVGANLMLLLMEAQEENWDEIERMVRAFQDVSLLLKYLERPVVVAPYGITVGGGAEIAMHCARTVAAAETYLGLVELGVGLIPAGGGCKEMALRAAAVLPPVDARLPNRPELIEFLTRPFEAIGTAKVSGSADEARDLGYLRPTDEIVMNGDHVLRRAKEAVLELDAEGYVAPAPARFPVAGPDGRAVLELTAYTLRNAGYASDYDLHLARKLAYVLTGGALPAGTPVPEQYLLDLEREAFLHLCGQPKTQARMAHMLQKNRPLRN
ncbi:MAG TPA: 3-hydroxyacyl-CoA dehydrogenase/enoyl-CoA hydratase family protein [Chloroflexota bacterium]|jgi:3-hydroxyacyl-CoA dehydrogenase|nr:3-hydroxyacyl-CoA dehydrogenase/enoyl-CoA hydratase family protein [Chloroflexota bacterium]